MTRTLSYPCVSQFPHLVHVPRTGMSVLESRVTSGSTVLTIDLVSTGV